MKGRFSGFFATTLAGLSTATSLILAFLLMVGLILGGLYVISVLVAQGITS